MLDRDGVHVDRACHFIIVILDKLDTYKKGGVEW
jgi:hypothetical protein